MYLWDVRGLAQRLKNGKIKQREFTLYCFLSPLLSISNGLFFGLLLFSHQIVENSFKGWLGTNHPHEYLYSVWSWSMTFLTIILSFLGIYLCYRVNQKGDGKDFFKRLACLSFPINFHIILYSLAALSITLIFLSFFLKKSVVAFQKNVWPEQATAQPLGFWESIWIIRTIPQSWETFLKDAREVILVAYPALSLVPPFLSFSHYMIVRRFMKKIAKKK